MRARVFLSLGANLGDRKQTLHKAVQLLPLEDKKLSPLFETPALLPSNADSWNIPFLNLVVEGTTEAPAEQLLETLKGIERDLGRKPAARWAPRLIDIDILLYGTQGFASEYLRIPHPEMLRRAFVLDPLSHLVPRLVLSNQLTVLQNARQRKHHQPALMGILNVTPDSFSENGINNSIDVRQKIFQQWSEQQVAFIDLGAESTRPGAVSVSAEEEWQRLKPVLGEIKQFFNGNSLAPKISIDTRHSVTAAHALEFGVDMINDVSGLTDPEMLDVITGSKARYVLMHSLSVPANPQESLPQDLNEVEILKTWFAAKMEWMESKGFPRERLVLDPGIGFGKTRTQNLNLLRGLAEFHDLECPLLVGPSRKSFMNVFCHSPFAERDPETLGISLAILPDIDILRVHDPVLHHRTLNAFFHARSP
ncbi:MAG TPA: dihydropteroate synthase [Pseudobdellovibrionaceae bacterium]